MLWVIVALCTLSVVTGEQFIVQLNNGTSLEQLRGHANHHNVTVLKHWSFAQFFGYLTDMTEELAHKLSADALVVAVAANTIGHVDLSCTEQSSPAWGLNRITHTSLIEDVSYCGPVASSEQGDVNAYILDTGIQCTHNEFKTSQGTSRVLGDEGFSSIGTSPCDDGHGHGTHVAGTVGGKTYGVAKGVYLIPIQVCDARGACPTDGILDGIQYVVTNRKKTGKRSVANMSLGIPKNSVLNNAVTSAISEDIVFAVSAGNDNFNADQKSPASCAEAITVGSTADDNIKGKQVDVRSDFSNYGSAVDIFGPGSSILSAWRGADDATNTISGTSMSTPHVTGAAALVIAHSPSISPEGVKQDLISRSQHGVIDMACEEEGCKSSPNKMLQINFVCDGTCA